MKDKLFKTLILLFFGFSPLFGEVSSTILSLDDTLGKIEHVELQKFKSGVIVRDLGENSVILGIAVYIGDDTIDIQKYTNLSQDSFPKLTSKVEAGDKVVFDIYNSRAMIIAPNGKEYSDFEKNLEGKSFVHSDILASYINKEGTRVPKEKHFKKMCNGYSLGSIYFLIENKSYEVDCNSFHIVDERDIKETKIDDDMIPFYHRFEKLSKGLFNYEDDITDYATYYKELIGVK